MIFNRWETYRGHLLSALPQHFVCAECGGRFVLRAVGNHTTAVECAADNDHSGFAAQQEYDEAQPPLGQETVRQDVLQGAMDFIPGLRRALNERARKALFGED